MVRGVVELKDEYVWVVDEGRGAESFAGKLLFDAREFCVELVTCCVRVRGWVVGDDGGKFCRRAERRLLDMLICLSGKNGRKIEKKTVIYEEASKYRSR